MMQATAAKRIHRGGFTVTRMFGWELPRKFPELEFSETQLETAAIVIEIPSAQGLRLSSLSRAILGAAKGGIKTAVVVFEQQQLVTSLDTFTLWLSVEEMWGLRQGLIQESKERREG
ncbi:hypothetical protein [Streptomyces sp. CFMR 7]|uniref:hypothetical protein n=1 Tax=Streptomyces sp. CFMR 7 TaxID=1649184 RepID=UPI0011A1B0A5|nr:hypothetical protein [Streptomyces sp. CFMR 7]